MKTSSHQHGRATVVAPRDAVVEGECDDVRRAVMEAVGNGSSHIVLDLSEVPFVDSAGLELFCELQTTCTTGGAHLKLASPDETCSEILRITDLDRQFQVYLSVEEAVRGLA